MYILHTYIHTYMYVGWKKRFECSNHCWFAAHSKLNFSLQSFTATPTYRYMFALVQSKCVIMWACSRKVEAVLLAASVSFLSPAILNPSRNSNRNKTSTHYKAIIQFWRLSMANQGKCHIDKNTCEPLNICFCNFRSSSNFLECVIRIQLECTGN